MLLDIAIGQSRNDLRWRGEKWTWEQLVNRCYQVHRSDETFAAYMAGDVEFKQSKKDVGGFVSGWIEGGRRLKTAVLSKQVVTLDVDYAKPDFLERLRATLPVTWVFYTTHSHSPEKPRYRLLVPLDRPVVQAEYEPIARYIAKHLGIEQFDRTCYDLNRLMFWPSASSDGVFESGHNEGQWASADGILAQYNDWRDISSWPVADGEFLSMRVDAAKLEDPRLKPGVIGAFCKMYNVHQLIRTFLSHLYTPTDEPHRYTYVNGSTSKGLLVFGDIHVTSFHNTDPASNQRVCNVFDLMRLHLFGGADDNPDQQMGNRKSFKAAAEYVRNLPEVRKALNIERYSPHEMFGVPDPGQSAQPASHVFQNPPQPLANGFHEVIQAQMPPGPVIMPLNGQISHAASSAIPGAAMAEPAQTYGMAPGDHDWLGELEVDPKGIAKGTMKNIKLILENDPRVKGSFGKDIFAKRIALRGMVPWIIPGRTDEWSNDDDEALEYFLETNYNIYNSEKVRKALNVVANTHGFHPVKEYLESHKWDGVPRIETLFHHFLGVEDNYYTRQVSRKWFTAAVARIYQPGIKFDYMPVFVGKAGLGKSYLIDKLGGKWFSDTSVDLRNKKESMEEMQGVWIMEWGELTSFRTSSIEAVKAFVSKRRDRYRAAYARRTEEHNRQVVFAGSTNVPKFLSDPDGNRRFWPLYVNRSTIQRSVHKDLTEHVRGQLWAEACYLYTMGEPLILDETASAMAEQVQKAHTEEDAREQTIYEYINKPVPLNWHEMYKGERAAFLGLGDFGNQPADQLQPSGDLAPRNKVSVIEIWVEALGGDIRNMTKQNTRIIHDVMRNMDDWDYSVNALHFGYYPRARGFVRKGYEVKTHEK